MLLALTVREKCTGFAARIRRRLAFGAMALLLGAAVPLVQGCSSTALLTSELGLLEEKELYNRARLRMRSGNYIGATELFRALVQRFPFGRYAEQTQVDIVYTLFMSYQVDEARVEADRFLRLYPQHQNADYARFLRAYTTFNRDDSVSSKAFKLNYARRDVSRVRQSFEELSQFLQLHPDSPYAPLARGRMLQLKEIMAFHELWVADFYIRRGAFIAAVNRTNWMLKHIPNTKATPWGLALMTVAYRKMDLPEEAEQSLMLLRENFPRHVALDGDDLIAKVELPDEERTMSSVLTLGLFDPPPRDEELLLSEADN